MNEYDGLIFDLSVPGRVGYSLPESDVPEADPARLLPAAHLRRRPAALPEVSEFDAVRHYTRLSRMNFGLDTHFYPLGSCTMKYNPKINEDMARLPGFARLHPLTPEDAAQGALQLMGELGEMLAEIVGMDATSLQPAAGAQGEMTGVLMIRAYHMDREGSPRKKILVPDSAHGTNPASTAIAGLPDGPDQVGRERRGGSPGPRAPPRRGRRRADDDRAQHARPVRVADSRGDRVVPREGRAGVHGWREPQRAARHHAPGRPRFRRGPHEPAQDVHHAPRRRRARGRAGRVQVATSRRSCRCPSWPATPTSGGSTGSGRSRSARCSRSGATSGCTSGPTPTSARWGRTGSARCRRTPS